MNHYLPYFVLGGLIIFALACIAFSLWLAGRLGKS